MEVGTFHGRWWNVPDSVVFRHFGRRVLERLEIRTIKIRVFYVGIIENGAGQRCIDQTRTGEMGATKYCARKIRTVEDRSTEICI